MINIKIALISDTHGKHWEYSLDTFKDVDILIHAGDASNSRMPYINLSEFIDFAEWYNKIDVKYKFYVPGNHDTAMYDKLINLTDYPNIKFLISTLYHIEEYDIKLYGFPYTSMFNNWAYMLNSNNMKLAVDMIEECDILISHGPPYGVLD